METMELDVEVIELGSAGDDMDVVECDIEYIVLE